ncbi:MAG: methyltransferase [Chitinophagaceae bacterium]|nr:methyltransferase [Oligoflexus sp.]
MSDFEIVHLRSGIKSLRQLSSQETFHPGIGPMAEARILHVDQQRIVERSARPGRFVIWDVGLGAAANAVAALEALLESGGEGIVEIHSFDKTLDPLAFALEHAEDLDYLLPHRELIETLIDEKYVRVNGRIQWFLHLGDFRDVMHDADLPSPHSVFYDPYSSVSNQEMWTLDHFRALRNRLGDDTPCLLTNYTGSSAVRVTWLMAGFYVGVGQGVGKKMETTVASNHLEMLKEPLSSNWLFKRQTSQSSAPLRDAQHQAQTISLADFENLSSQPQFQ